MPYQEKQKGEAETDTKDTQYVGDFIKGEYHKLNCKLILQIDDKNWIWFSSVAKARGAGFKPCKTCAPPISEPQRTSSPKMRPGAVLETVPGALGWVLVALSIVLAISILVSLELIGIGIPLVVIFLIIMLVVWLIRQDKLGR